MTINIPGLQLIVKVGVLTPSGWLCLPRQTIERSGVTIRQFSDWIESGPMWSLLSAPVFPKAKEKPKARPMRRNARAVIAANLEFLICDLRTHVDVRVDHPILLPCQLNQAFNVPWFQCKCKFFGIRVGESFQKIDVTGIGSIYIAGHE